jgi:hypothetical protein
MYLLLFYAPSIWAQWYQEEEQDALTLMAGTQKGMKLYPEDGASTYQDQKAFFFGIAKSVIRIHGHGQIDKMLLLRHASLQANYYNGYKSLSMTNAEAHLIGRFSLGHLIFVGVEGGVYLAVPIVFKGKTVRTGVPAFSSEYERPYLYQGFIVGGNAGIKLKPAVLGVHIRQNIPFIQLYKPQPEADGVTSIKPQLLQEAALMFSITLKR